MEVKYISELPSMKAKLLKHPFEGDQQTFMESVVITGNKAFGLVALGDKKNGRLYLIQAGDIPADGNWNTEDFLKNQPKREYHWGNWYHMVVYALTGKEYDGE